MGIVYLKLALECIYHWQKKFKSDDKNPTAFSEVYDNLLKSKVTFPKPDEFIFFTPPPKKKKPVVDNNVQSTKNPPKQSTPSGFGNPDQDKTKLLREKKGENQFKTHTYIIFCFSFRNSRQTQGNH